MGYIWILFVMVVKRMLSSSSDSLLPSHDKKDTTNALSLVHGVTDSISCQDETKGLHNTKLDRFFTPDNIYLCHFSFEDILWKPTASRFRWWRTAPKPNPLFQIVSSGYVVNRSSKKRNSSSLPGCPKACMTTGLGPEMAFRPSHPLAHGRTRSSSRWVKERRRCLPLPPSYSRSPPKFLILPSLSQLPTPASVHYPPLVPAHPMMMVIF